METVICPTLPFLWSPPLSRPLRAGLIMLEPSPIKYMVQPKIKTRKCLRKIWLGWYIGRSGYDNPKCRTRWLCQNTRFAAFFIPDFCRTCFDHICPSPTPLRSTPFLIDLPFCPKKKPTVQPACATVGCVNFHWSVLNLLLKRTDTLSSSRTFYTKPSLTFPSPVLSNDSLVFLPQGRREAVGVRGISGPQGSAQDSGVIDSHYLLKAPVWTFLGYKNHLEKAVLNSLIQ